jgi:septal ring factor EnvC (AmiA/AmiB activator)
MKTLLLTICLTVSAFADDFATQVKALQSADNWPAIEAVLVQQRADLMGANQKAVADAVATFQTAVTAKSVDLANVTAERDAAVQALKDKEARINAVLTKYITAEAASGQGPKFQLLMSLKTEAEKPEKVVAAEALASEIAAKKAALAADEARLLELGK